MRLEPLVPLLPIAQLQDDAQCTSLSTRQGICDQSVNNTTCTRTNCNGLKPGWVIKMADLVSEGGGSYSTGCFRMTAKKFELTTQARNQ